MSLTRDAQQTHLNPVDAAGGKHWWLVDQAVAMLGRGRQLANKHDGQQHSFYMVATA
ncbi:hypothetical protein [Xanthomonas nasturtii]|uniref:hypothetical protein n=1 Tax=Xanthomonas nasturtii TaxID=1843581 RepID=UPI002011C06B|nr:hypothetical protein [Xanthomonas nasturtii]MCL1559953.1 hypothetical protein [Xanthomonas nasturtii]